MSLKSYKHVVAIGVGTIAGTIGITHFDPERSDEDGRYQHRILPLEDAKKAEQRGIGKIEGDATEAEFKAQQMGVSARPAEVAAERLKEMDDAPLPLGASTATGTAAMRNFPDGQGPKAATLNSGTVDPDAAPGGGDDKSILDLGVKKLPAALENVETVEEIDSLIEQEKAKEEPRQGALDALEKRKAALTGSAE